MVHAVASSYAPVAGHTVQHSVFIAEACEGSVDNQMSLSINFFNLKHMSSELRCKTELSEGLCAE